MMLKFAQKLRYHVRTGWKREKLLRHVFKKREKKTVEKN